jgi:predicted RNase H-like HicB family nuclease
MLKHYIAIVHKDEDSAWGAHFPDLEGVFSAADDHDQIRANCREALELFLDDAKNLPKQRAIEELIADPEVRNELSQGAFLLEVPYIQRTGRVVKANTTFDEAELQAFDAEAKRRGLTRSAFLAEGAKALLG